MENKYPLLEAREKTDGFEKKLLKDFPESTLVVIRANIPGEKKGCIESCLIVYKIFSECEKKVKPLKIFHSYTNEEGLIFFLIVKTNPYLLKNLTVQIEEEHFLGRLADIDVLTSDKLFSRADLKISGRDISLRKCFLCGEPAAFCARSLRHSKNEIINFINKKVYFDFLKGNLTDKLASFAEAAMLTELCRIYGFGCVTANGKGSHSDMDFLLMLKCIPLAGNAVRNLTLKECASFSELRNYGKKTELELFNLTNGVNTYKGAFFLLLILNACVYRLIHRGKSFNYLSEEIKKFSREVKKDFELKNCSEVSLNTFLTVGDFGIRGEVLSGLDFYFKTLLPMLKDALNTDYGKTGLNVEPKITVEKIVLKLISETCDTTVIKRKGYEKLKELQKKAKAVLSSPESVFDLQCARLSSWCEKENISTGGSADRLIVLYNLFLLEKFFAYL
ncbi:citrate lyase holo-[acyl-carrier protein] synthase [Treponema pedis]|uniref:CitXG protein n=5 Tax=Treponema pedis TaxID=409322 RepID=S5ZW17_9SPIR|nr:citrate lyase holo-[acyl-carrier protein] synthase [Treponema pedis]AGT44515.1 citXG protein [Treponema pedis str. T A4]